VSSKSDIYLPYITVDEDDEIQSKKLKKIIAKHYNCHIRGCANFRFGDPWGTSPKRGEETSGMPIGAKISVTKKTDRKQT